LQLKLDYPLLLLFLLLCKLMLSYPFVFVSTKIYINSISNQIYFNLFQKKGNHFTETPINIGKIG
jgi:hypothetical protein